MTYLVIYTMATIANHIKNIYLASESCSFLIINDYMPTSKRTLKQRNTVFPPGSFFFLILFADTVLRLPPQFAAGACC